MLGFGKEWTVRRDDTITFIRTAQVTTNADKRGVIADILEKKYPMSQQDSKNLTQGKNWAVRNRAGAKLNRSYKRACLAIRVGILGHTLPAAKASVAVIPDAMLSGALGTDLGLAFNYERIQLFHALHQLRTTPGAFLAEKPLKMQARYNYAGACPCMFYYNYDRGEYHLKPNTQDNRSDGVRVVGALGQQQYNAVFIRVNVYNLPWRAYSAVSGNIGTITGSVIQNNDLMVTDQLTGCSLMFNTNGVNMTAIHVQPDGPPDSAGRGNNLAANLRAHGQFINGQHGGVTQVFGNCVVENRPLDYNNDLYAETIGILRNGEWEIWVQTRERTFDAPIRGAWQVY